MNLIRRLKMATLGWIAMIVGPSMVKASEADLVLPDFGIVFNLFGTTITGRELLTYSIVIVLAGLVFGFWEFTKIKKLPAHKSMLEVSALIYETCKTYLLQQGRLLILLEVLIGTAIFAYFYYLRHLEIGRVGQILLWSVLGILGSFGVANYKASFTAQTRHSWYFASVAGESWTEFQSNSGVGNLQINGNGGPSPEDGFLIKSIARNCTVQPGAKVVAGFLVCENFKILARSEALNFVGTLITKKMEIDPSALNAGVYFQSIFHPDGVALLRSVGILEGSSGSYDCNVRATDPTWNPYPNYTSLSNVFHCSPASLRKNADNFRWTAVDPDCGIVPGGTTTSCKGIKDRFMVKELYRRSKL